MTFFKSKVFLLWLVLNALLPICVVIMFGQLSLEIKTQSYVAIVTVIVIQAGNIYAIFRFSSARIIYAVTIALNVLALILIGAVSFVTSIPDLPVIFNGS